VRVLLIDNYDSFTWNLQQGFAALGAEVDVLRNDALDGDAIAAGSWDRIVISPGPCGPTEAGVSVAAVLRARPEVPILGVCLGHQCIGAAFGASIVRAPKPVHGRDDLIRHDGRGALRGLPDPLRAARYHSLVVDAASLPEVLEVTARTSDGVIMGLRHRTRPVEGVQFHPESYLTPQGPQLLRNFLEAPA
jgi:anthranilate synthase component 2